MRPLFGFFFGLDTICLLSLRFYSRYLLLFLDFLPFFGILFLSFLFLTHTRAHTHSLSLALALLSRLNCTVEETLTRSEIRKQTFRKTQRKLAHVHAVPGFSKQATNGFNFCWIHFVSPVTAAFTQPFRDNRRLGLRSARTMMSRIISGQGKMSGLLVLLHTIVPEKLCLSPQR